MFKCLENGDDDDFSILNDHDCPYLTNDQFSDSLKSDLFTVVSINIRSLPGKINELSNFLHNSNNNIVPTCVAIQEVWNVPAGVQFNIEGYHPFIYNIRDKSGLSSNKH